MSLPEAETPCRPSASGLQQQPFLRPTSGLPNPKDFSNMTSNAAPVKMCLNTNCRRKGGVYNRATGASHLSTTKVTRTGLSGQGSLLSDTTGN